MSQVSEIKCPVCDEWSTWTSNKDEKCPNCHEYFNPGRVRYEEENKIKAETIRKNSYLVIKESDDPIVKMFKQFVNWLRWSTYYGISAIYFVIAVMIIVFGLIML